MADKQTDRTVRVPEGDFSFTEMQTWTADGELAFRHASRGALNGQPLSSDERVRFLADVTGLEQAIAAFGRRRGWEPRVSLDT